MRDLRTENWKEVGEALERLLIARNMSSQTLADKAGVDRKTVDRLRHGEAVRLRTLAWIETALGVNLGLRAREEAEQRGQGAEIAPARLGGYARAHYLAYEGDWWGFRRSFDHPGRVICHHTRLFWEREQNRLVFEERQSNLDGERRREYLFRGELSIPASIGVIYFMTIGGGSARVAATTLLRQNGPETYMKGVMLALAEMAEVGFYPVVSPLYMVKAERPVTAADLEARLGSHPIERLWRPGVRAALEDVEKRFCRMGGWTGETGS